VLTVPPGDPDNVILGADFASFLRLKYFGCFGWLEVLAFDLAAGDTETTHLAELQRRYLPHVVLPEREEWDARHGL
jgi:hypothetical protein